MSTALAVAASGPAPSLELRERILDAARAEKPNVVSLEERRRSRAVPVLGAVAALAAAAALALGLWGASTASELDDTRTALERERAAAALLADPAARTVDLEAGEGRLVVGEGGEAVLVLDALDEAPAGKTYEAWVLDGDTPVRAGVFDGSATRDVVPLEQTVGAGSRVLVTVERRGRRRRSHDCSDRCLAARLSTVRCTSAALGAKSVVRRRGSSRRIPPPPYPAAN